MLFRSAGGGDGDRAVGGGGGAAVDGDEAACGGGCGQAGPAGTSGVGGASGPARHLPRPPSGFSLAGAGSATVGAHILYWWPSDGWQRGVVARAHKSGAFSHVVRYHRATSALHGKVDTLLDAASYGARWVLLVPVTS